MHRLFKIRSSILTTKRSEFILTVRLTLVWVELFLQGPGHIKFYRPWVINWSQLSQLSQPHGPVPKYIRRHLGSYKGTKKKIHSDSLQTGSFCVSWFKFYWIMTALTFTKLAYLKRQYSRKSTEKTCFIVTSYIRIVFGAIVHWIMIALRI